VSTQADIAADNSLDFVGNVGIGAIANGGRDTRPLALDR
jgi:hypothetical protein